MTTDVAGQIRGACEGIIAHYVAALTPGKAGKPEGIIHGSKNEPPMPLPLGVLNARAMTDITLAQWATVIVEKRHLTSAPTRHDALGMARFIILHSEWLAGDAGQIAADEITDCAQELAGVANGVRRPGRIPVGRCIDVNDEQTSRCEGFLVAHMSPPGIIRCSDQPEHHYWTSLRWPNLKLKMARLDPEGTAQFTQRLVAHLGSRT